MWIIIAQIVCIVAAIGLVAMVYDLDSQTSPFVRYGLLVLSVAFFAVFGACFTNRHLYEHAAAIAFTGLGVMVLALIGYLCFSRHVQPIVLKVSGGALAIILFVWLIGNLSDMKRQKVQLDKDTPNSKAVTIGDSTQKAIGEFNRLSGNE